MARRGRGSRGPARPPPRRARTREVREAGLKKRFPNIVAGVGDKVSDANAYLANGLNAIIIGPERDDGLPAKAIWVKTWAEIEKLLKAPDASSE